MNSQLWLLVMGVSISGLGFAGSFGVWYTGGMVENVDRLLLEAREFGVSCPGCGALMVPATTTLSWWDCINPYCVSGKQPE